MTMICPERDYILSPHAGAENLTPGFKDEIFVKK